MAGNDRKKPEEEQEPGAPAWMATFGDLMSLLLTFFVLIVSFSTIQESEFKNAIWSLRGAFSLFKQKGVEVSLSGKMGMHEYSRPNEMNRNEEVREGDLLEKQEQILAHFSAELRDFLKKTRYAKFIKVKAVKRGLKISISDKILFNPGYAVVKRDAYPVLRQIVKMLRPIDFDVIIEGFTDSHPIHNEEYASNWELSSARAMGVLKFFIRSRFPGNRLSAAAYGDNKPISSNATEEGRSKNRRVEILILKEKPK